MEPVIKNCHEIASLHPQSLNTVRVVTVNMTNRVEIAFTYLRVGQNDSIIDNAASGGIVCELDIETGIVYATSDEQGNCYIIHPNSGKILLGYKVPQWGELKKMVSELAMVLPSNRYTGWDMALTDNGWILIEANARGQFIAHQMINTRGCRKQFDAYLSELDV